MSGMSGISLIEKLKSQGALTLPNRMKRPCPDCGRLLRRGKDNTKWFCDNPKCPVIYVIFDPLWLEPIKIARESRRRER